MNPYNFSVLFFSFCTFFISILIWLKRGDKVGWFYFIFSTVVTIWGVFWSVLLNQSISYETALLSARIAHSAAVGIAVLWFHFVLIFRGKDAKGKTLLYILYLGGAFIVATAFTPWFIPTVGPTLGFKYYTKPGFIFHIFMVVYWLGVIFGFVELFQKVRESKGEEKLQALGFFIATFSGFIGGSLIQAPIYNINFPQYNLFLMPIYPFLMAYFMIRRGLFDVEQIAQIFQKEKLATIGLLAASINHEIRNPLYAVKGLLETYIENEKEGLPHKTPLETSEKALKQVHRALEVIQKLNRFSKPAHEAPVLEDTSVNEAVHAVLDLISYEFSLEKIEIKNLLQDNLPQIKADPRQLEEILFNLIVNACHAMKDGGELVIASEEKHASDCHREASEAGRGDLSTPRLLRRPFGTSRNDEFIQITISDTGTGISSEQVKHLFEPFYTTKGEKGTGLGLYITKQLIERNGGKISAKSKPERGTSFVLEFKVK